MTFLRGGVKHPSGSLTNPFGEDQQGEFGDPGGLEGCLDKDVHADFICIVVLYS